MTALLQAALDPVGDEESCQVVERAVSVGVMYLCTVVRHSPRLKSHLQSPASVTSILSMHRITSLRILHLQPSGNPEPVHQQNTAGRVTCLAMQQICCCCTRKDIQQQKEVYFDDALK